MDQQEMYTLDQAREIIKKEQQEKKYTLDEAKKEIDHIIVNVDGWYRARIPMQTTAGQKLLGGVLVPYDQRMLYGATK